MSLNCLATLVPSGLNPRPSLQPMAGVGLVSRVFVQSIGNGKKAAMTTLYSITGGADTHAPITTTQVAVLSAPYTLGSFASTGPGNPTPLFHLISRADVPMSPATPGLTLPIRVSSPSMLTVTLNAQAGNTVPPATSAQFAVCDADIFVDLFDDHTAAGGYTDHGIAYQSGQLGGMQPMSVLLPAGTFYLCVVVGPIATNKLLFATLTYTVQPVDPVASRQTIVGPTAAGWEYY